MDDSVARYQVRWDDAAELVRIDWLPGSVCGLDEARAVTGEIRAMGLGAVPILVDMRGTAKLDRAAREHFVDDQGDVRAVALLTGSAVTRMMANFFIGLQRMPVPMQMFTREAEAVTWLRGQR